jgi:hypothetical protein
MSIWKKVGIAVVIAIVAGWIINGITEAQHGRSLDRAATGAAPALEVTTTTAAPAPTPPTTVASTTTTAPPAPPTPKPIQQAQTTRSASAPGEAIVYDFSSRSSDDAPFFAELWNEAVSIEHPEIAEFGLVDLDDGAWVQTFLEVSWHVYDRFNDEVRTCADLDNFMVGYAEGIAMEDTGPGDEYEWAWVHATFALSTLTADEDLAFLAHCGWQ